MIKLICFVKRHPDLSVGEFHARWRDVHGPLIAGTPAATSRLVRYEQNSRLARDYERPDSPAYDGVAIQWYRSPRDFFDMISDPGYARVTADEQSLLDFDGLLWMLTEEEEVMIPGPDRRSGTEAKLHCLVKRRPGMDVDDFHRHWRDVHGPLNRETPAIARHFVRYEQNHRLARDYERTDTDFDGVAVEWFPSVREFFAMIAEPDYPEKIAPDEPRFMDVDGLRFILTESERVILPA